jgi:type IV pilus assembly protein PilA
MKKGFTLIELLIVVAIIGILAAVGTPIFQGFIEEAKIGTTRANHRIISNFISSTSALCAAGAKQVTLSGLSSTAGSKYGSFNCSQLQNVSEQLLNNYAAYLRYAAGTNNPYEGDRPAIYTTRRSYPPPGSTDLWVSGNREISIRTNLGPNNNSNNLVNAIVLIE